MSGIADQHAGSILCLRPLALRCVQVRNGGKTAMKVMVVKRPDVSDYFQFSPDFGRSRQRLPTLSCSAPSLHQAQRSIQ